LELKHGENILIADDPDSFASEISRALSDYALLQRIEKNGITTANERFGWPAIGARLAHHYDTLISKPR
jgi:glycosyltransferase involved in cell wall biosynthesis